MRKLRRRRFVAFSALAAASFLIAAAPAGAETLTESPSSTPEPVPTAPEVTPPATTAPGSTGWIPQGGSTETSSGGAAPTRRGSSLGSGGGPRQTEASSAEEPSYSTGSSGSYEPESSTSPEFEEPAREPQGVLGVQAESGAGPAPRPTAKATRERGADVGVGTSVTLSESSPPQSAETSSALPAAASFAKPDDQGASGSSVLPLLAVIVFGLISLYAAGRLVFGPIEPLRR